jgi:hypothetical protein
LQRIDSRKQYQENLRQFALSAYRRISDIGKSVKRIKYTIEAKRISYPKDRIHELDAIEILAEELADTVSSSMLDWVDIIGDELKKKERIESLQLEQQHLEQQAIINAKKNDNETLQRLEEVRGEINSLKSDLPLLLQKDISPILGSATWKPTEVLNAYAKQAKNFSAIRFKVNLFHFTNQDFDLEKIRQGTPYAVVLVNLDITLRATVVDKGGNLVGEIENPFVEFTQNDFITGLLSVLNAVTNLDGLSHQMSLTQPIVLQNANISSLDENYLELTMPADEGCFVGG